MSSRAKLTVRSILRLFSCASLMMLVLFSCAHAADRGTIATVHPLATRAGEEAYAKGGNAIDAAIAAAVTLAVVDGHNSGLGGGSFILIHRANGRVEAIDAREMAPARAHRDMFIRNGVGDISLSTKGALSIGIPGTVAAFDFLMGKGSNLTFKDILLPAAELAEQGFPINKIYADRLRDSAADIRGFPETAAILLDPKGEAWPLGHHLIQTDLALTLRALAEKGSDHFYKGEFAQAAARWMEANGGIISAKDFADYQWVSREPVKSTYHDYTVYGFPPPSSGGVHVAQILNILEHFDLEALPVAERYHVMAEAMKQAFADRAHWLGDPDFAPVPKGLLDKGYAATLAKKIGLKKRLKNISHGQPPNATLDTFGKHTTHIAAADKEGNWVAITTTVNTDFGSYVTIPGTGVIMNNQMDDFAIQPGVPNSYGLLGTEANSVQPLKRPLSSMSPTIVMQGKRPVMTVGAAGGSMIITEVVLALVNKLTLGMPLYDALAAPKIHHQWRPDAIVLEDSVPEGVRKDLQQWGHVLADYPDWGSTQAIAVDRHGNLVGVEEPRLQIRNSETGQK